MKEENKRDIEAYNKRHLEYINSPGAQNLIKLGKLPLKPEKSPDVAGWVIVLGIATVIFAFIPGFLMASFVLFLIMGGINNE